MKTGRSVKRWMNQGLISARVSTLRAVHCRRRFAVEDLETRSLITTFVVSTMVDELDADISTGDLSLREAIGLANVSSGHDRISFSTSTNGVELDLTMGQIEIADSLTIVGLGQASTIIDARQASRIFKIFDADVTLDSMTLKNGRTTGDSFPTLDGGRFGGGAISSPGPGKLIINNSTLSGNSTTGEFVPGGAIYCDGDLTINKSTLSFNSTSGSQGDGGAIYSTFGKLTISQSTISKNSTTGESANGGAVFSLYGSVIVRESTLSENSTSGNRSTGGAVSVLESNITVSNSTISGNSTSGSEADGGAIFSLTSPYLNPEGRTIEISQSTVTKNRSGGSLGGGIRSRDAAVVIQNSIIAGNTDLNGAPEINRSTETETIAPVSVTSSLIGRNNGTGLTATAGLTPDANGNITGGSTFASRIDPRLAPLADNGGLTQTHILLTDSPALNRGRNSLAVDVTKTVPAALITDQRGSGFTRILGGTVDMGAVEARVLNGTSGANSFVLTYSSSLSGGTVTVTVATNGGAVTSLGTFLMKSPLIIDGAGGTDTVRLAGTSGGDTFTVSSAGLVTNGAMLSLKNIENTTLAGLAGNDIYKFDVDAALGLLTLDESAGGTDSIDFTLTTTVPVNLNLGNAATQIVHATNLNLILGSSTNFENANGGAGSDTLIGNSLPNRLAGGSGNNVLVGLNGADTLIGGTGRDILIGGLGLDTLNGDAGDDILIAGRTSSDTNFSNLNTLRTGWISSASYSTRVTNLRAGVGSPVVSLKAKTNVLNDSGEDDLLTGGTDTDWYLRAVDDAITDLFAGEFSDVL